MCFIIKCKEENVNINFDGKILIWKMCMCLNILNIFNMKVKVIKYMKFY